MGFLLPRIIASPISRYSGETVLSEEVPAGWIIDRHRQIDLLNITRNHPLCTSILTSLPLGFDFMIRRGGLDSIELNPLRKGWIAGKRRHGTPGSKNPSPPLIRLEMGLRCQSEKSLCFLPSHHHQHSNGSNSEEGVGGGFGYRIEGINFVL